MKDRKYAIDDAVKIVTDIIVKTKDKVKDLAKEYPSVSGGGAALIGKALVAAGYAYGGTLGGMGAGIAVNAAKRAIGKAIYSKGTNKFSAGRGAFNSFAY